MRRGATDLMESGVPLVHMPILPAEEGLLLPKIEEQVQWCENTCKGDYAPWFDPQEGFVFLFVEPDDAFAYRMRWQ
ncbi:MAG: hypothetical protein EOP83_32880 [Verrucomicrobiaceae bacterium]|nr:MAG: hypothetical protein EOP83_32880 [Verrucomicrobiaceae bacterium]